MFLISTPWTCSKAELKVTGLGNSEAQVSKYTASVFPLHLPCLECISGLLDTRIYKLDHSIHWHSTFFKLPIVPRVSSIPSSWIDKTLPGPHPAHALLCSLVTSFLSAIGTQLPFPPSCCNGSLHGFPTGMSFIAHFHLSFVVPLWNCCPSCLLILGHSHSCYLTLLFIIHLQIASLFSVKYKLSCSQLHD